MESMTQYIWLNKFKEPFVDISLNAFKNILKFKIGETKNVCELIKDWDQYAVWDNVYLFL